MGDSAMDALYEERARIAVALARAAQALGHHVGFGVDPSEPKWPVLYINLPTGQVSWHLMAEQRQALASDIGEYDGEWDKHTTPEKYDRLSRWRSPLTPKQLSEFLYDEWDPIGVNDSAPRDEYENYALAIYDILMDFSGGSLATDEGALDVAQIIAGHLADVREVMMEIDPDMEKDQRIAFAIVDMARKR